MPPARSRPPADDARSDVSMVRERQVAAAAHARKSRTGAAKQPYGRNARDAVGTSSETAAVGGAASAAAGGPGMAWNTAPLELLDAYRVAHNLTVPAAFTSPLHQALLTNPGIGRHSPTMARQKDRRRISKEQLALAVRKNFNGAAVSEIDVVVDLVYKIRYQDKAFRRRSTQAVSKAQ